MKFFRLIFLPLLALSFLGMAKKTAVAVRFHVEANARDGEPFSVPAKFHSPDRDGFVQRIPFVSERDVAAIYPVEAADGTYGCAFKLDTHGTLGLRTTSSDKRGATIVAMVSTKAGTRQVAQMVIDKPINDGIIFIPNGLTLAEIAELRKQFPIMGQTGKRK